MRFHRYVVFPSLALATVVGLASALPSVTSELFPAPADTQHGDAPAVLLVLVTRADSLHTVYESGRRPEGRPEPIGDVPSHAMTRSSALGAFAEWKGIDAPKRAGAFHSPVNSHPGSGGSSK